MSVFDISALLCRGHDGDYSRKTETCFSNTNNRNVFKKL